jgi:hypothetical protein
MKNEAEIPITKIIGHTLLTPFAAINPPITYGDMDPPVPEIIFIMELNLPL